MQAELLLGHLLQPAGDALTTSKSVRDSPKETRSDREVR